MGKHTILEKLLQQFYGFIYRFKFWISKKHCKQYENIWNMFDKWYDIVYSELILKHSFMGTIRKDQDVTGVAIESDFHNIVDNILSYLEKILI